MSEPFLIRDVYSSDVVKKIATDIKSEYKKFDKKGFQNSILPALSNQTYSERKENITQSLIDYLPEDYEHSVDILLKITPPPYPSEEISDTMGRFYISCFTYYISKLGLESYDISVNALYEMTKSFTAEWDIRPFILKYPDKTLLLLKTWAKDKNPHIRRFVSEGSRPNLPWGKKLNFIDNDPERTTLPILSLLQNDESEYVRRSVANHLNDLAKNNADIVVKHLTKWSKNQPSINKDRMISHALRTLIKQGHQGALSLIGYSDDFNLDVNIVSFTKKVKWGQKFDFAFAVKNNKKTSQKLLIDFVIGFQKKGGTISDKVFKLRKTELAARDQMDINKSHSFKKISTRVYYPGMHTLALQINGKIVEKVNFELLKQ